MRCPQCGKDVRVRVDGALYVHHCPRLTWERIPGTLADARSDMWSASGYLIAPVLVEGAPAVFNLRGFRVFVPTSDGASLVFWRTCDTLEQAKRVAREHRNGQRRV